jgi:hypothetical protein
MLVQSAEARHSQHRFLHPATCTTHVHHPTMSYAQVSSGTTCDISSKSTSAPEHSRCAMNVAQVQGLPIVTSPA